MERDSAISSESVQASPRDARASRGCAEAQVTARSARRDVPPGVKERRLMGKGAGQGDMDATGRTFHLAADLEQLQPDRRRLAARQLGALKAAPKMNEQHLRTGTQNQPQGVGVEQIA